jgi:hypothetical protein
MRLSWACAMTSQPGKSGASRRERSRAVHLRRSTSGC